MESFRLDRNSFKAGNHQSASNNFVYWKDKSFAERLKAANYLISVAYNFPLNSPPRMDRTAFSARKMQE